MAGFLPEGAPLCHCCDAETISQTDKGIRIDHRPFCPSQADFTGAQVDVGVEVAYGSTTLRIAVPDVREAPIAVQIQAGMVREWTTIPQAQAIALLDALRERYGETEVRP